MVRNNYLDIASSSSITAFILLLLTPYAFPAFFPFDVNILLASSAVALFTSSIIMQNKWLYLSKKMCAAFLVILCIQLFLLSSNQLLAVGAWQLHTLQYFSALLMFIIGASVTSSSLVYLMKAYILVAISWGAVGLFVWLGGTSGEALQIGSVTLAFPPSLKISGPFNPGNIFAAAIGIAWLFSHWLYFQEKDHIYAISIVFFTALLFDTLSRGGWVTYLITLAFLLFSIKPNWILFTKQLIPTWIAGLVLGVVFFEFSNPLAPSNDIEIISQTVSTSFFARIMIWIVAIAEFTSAPLTGVGWGQFQPEFWNAKPTAILWIKNHLNMDIPFSHIPYNAHNIFLHTLAEAGIIAFLILCWIIKKLTQACIKLIARGDNLRLPFALAAISFVIQSQLNTIFHRPVILFIAAFFAGIALAPWLWKHSWKLRLAPYVKGSSIIFTSLIVIWSSQQTIQWFKLEQDILHLNIEDKVSVDSLAGHMSHPRRGALALTWLGFVVATEHQHMPLLKWVAPYLKPNLSEVPSILANQVLFYSLSFSQEYDEACKIGTMISSQRIPGEKNDQGYRDTCYSNKIKFYTFGH